jgi:hypothetical protein
VDIDNHPAQPPAGDAGLVTQTEHPFSASDPVRPSRVRFSEEDRSSNAEDLVGNAYSKGAILRNSCLSRAACQLTRSSF